MLSTTRERAVIMEISKQDDFFFFTVLHCIQKAFKIDQIVCLQTNFHNSALKNKVLFNKNNNFLCLENKHMIFFVLE